MPGELIPIVGMVTGIIMTVGVIVGIVKVAHSPLGLALSRRILGHTAEADAEVKHELAYLRDQVESLQRQVDETQERVDFAERLLAQSRATGRLPEGR